MTLQWTCVPYISISNFRPCIWPDVTGHALSDLFGAQHLLGSCEVEEPDVPSLHHRNLRKIHGDFVMFGKLGKYTEIFVARKITRFSTDPPCLGVISWDQKQYQADEPKKKQAEMHVPKVFEIVELRMVTLGFQPPLKQWVEKYNHHC